MGAGKNSCESDRRRKSPGSRDKECSSSMGNRQYIEIISIDTKQTATSQTAELIRRLRAPQLITWAAATTNIVSLLHLAKEAGFAIEGPINGSRVKPDGGILRWKTLRVLTDCGDAIPFHRMGCRYRAPIRGFAFWMPARHLKSSPGSRPSARNTPNAGHHGNGLPGRECAIGGCCGHSRR